MEEQNMNNHVLPGLGLIPDFRMSGTKAADSLEPVTTGCGARTVTKDTKLSPYFLERLRHKYANDSEYAEKKREYARKVYERNKEKCRERARLQYHRRKLLKSVVAQETNATATGDVNPADIKVGDFGRRDLRQADPTSCRSPVVHRSCDLNSLIGGESDPTLSNHGNTSKQTKLAPDFLERLRIKYATDAEFAQKKRELSRRTYHRHKEKYLERAKQNYERQKRLKKSAGGSTSTEDSLAENASDKSNAGNPTGHVMEQCNTALPPGANNLQTPMVEGSDIAAEKKREYMRNRYKMDSEYRARRCEDARRRYCEKVGGMYSRKPWKQTVSDRESCSSSTEQMVKTRLIDIIKKNLDGHPRTNHVSAGMSKDVCTGQSSEDSCTQQTLQDMCTETIQKNPGDIGMVDWSKTSALHRIPSTSNHDNPPETYIQNTKAITTEPVGHPSVLSPPLDGSAFRYTGPGPLGYPNIYLGGGFFHKEPSQ